MSSQEKVCLLSTILYKGGSILYSLKFSFKSPSSLYYVLILDIDLTLLLPVTLPIFDLIYIL